LWQAVTMNKILQKTELAPKILQYVVEAPRIAKKAQPGHFVVVMANERSERVPLTIADFDRQQGTVTLVLMVVGTSTMQLSSLNAGDSLYALIGPLGKPSEIEKVDTVVMMAGGVGTAPIYPIARALKEAGAADVYAAATHPVLSGKAFQRIEESDLKTMLVTDTVPLRQESAKIEVASVAPIFAEAVKRTFKYQSISSLFDIDKS
jgi:ferredoxin--NADP+ reductase